VFNTKKSGKLQVKRQGEHLVLDFPLASLTKIEASSELIDAIGCPPSESYQTGQYYLLIYQNQEDITAMTPDFDKLLKINIKGICVSAPGSNVDFVSRFFAPRLGVNEDPVTGSAHTALTPYWAKRLGKKGLSATQLSKRQGSLKCWISSDRVFISGRAKGYLIGSIEV
jgi:PhzF family phenazine biosynthesis protein